MAFGVGINMTWKDFGGLRGSNHLLGHLRDLSLEHFIVSSNGVHFLCKLCNALVAILLFLVVGHVLFEFINDYVNMWCVYLFIIIYVK